MHELSIQNIIDIVTPEINISNGVYRSLSPSYDSKQDFINLLGIIETKDTGFKLNFKRITSFELSKQPTLTDDNIITSFNVYPNKRLVDDDYCIIGYTCTGEDHRIMDLRSFENINNIRYISPIFMNLKSYLHKNNKVREVIEQDTLDLEEYWKTLSETVRQKTRFINYCYTGSIFQKVSRSKIQVIL